MISGRAAVFRPGSGDADTVIIAGMGGNLIWIFFWIILKRRSPSPVLSFSREIIRSFLRRWAAQTPEFVISRELLAEEDGRLCEIIVVENALAGGDKAADLFFKTVNRRRNAIQKVAARFCRR